MTSTGNAGTIVGYDARELWLGEPESWGEEWKSTALVRHDIDKPLSIDRAVWSSVFDFHLELEPRYTGLYAGLWDRLNRLRRHLRREELREKPYSIVAFTVLAAEDEPETSDAIQWRKITAPNELDAGWRFLGYDVADDSAISALVTMRSAADAADPEAYRARWAGHLNRGHLFADLGPATEFKLYSNGAIPGHAPFFVYGLWSIGDVETETTR